MISVSIKRLHRFLSISRLKNLGLRGERAGASDRRVLAPREMQAFRRLVFHSGTKCVAFDVSGHCGTIKDRYADPGRDQKENRNHRRIDQQFLSHDWRGYELNR